MMDVYINVDCIMDKVGIKCKKGFIIIQICMVTFAVVEDCVGEP